MSGRPRVAHVVSAKNASLLASLEQKRQSLASISARIKNGTMAKKADMRIAKKRKPNYESEEDELELPDAVESDESFNISDEEEEVKRKRKPVANGYTNSAPLTNVHKERTLSETSEDSEREWLGKQNFQAQEKKMQTRVSAPKPKKRVFISDESEDENEQATTLKDVARTAQKQKKRFASSDDEYEDPEDFNSEQEISESDSEVDEHLYVKKSETKKERNCKDFFNTASKEDIVSNAKVSDKENILLEIPHGKKALENYFDHMENRGILDSVLADCKGHAAAVEAGFEECTESTYQPKLLTPGFNLHDYQKIGLSWLIMMYKKGFNCILGDEMGLGKTIQIVAFLAWMKEEAVPGPHLIVVPSSTIENWMGEMRKWCSDIRLMTYYGSQDERKQIRKMVKKKKENIDVILTTYNMISSKHDDKKFFKNFSMNYVIYDEGHMLKNCSTDRYKNLMKVRGKRKILLTGTPLQNNLVELISLMYFVMTNVFNKYCEDITQLLGQFKALGPGLENTSENLYRRDRIEEAKLILQPYILRRLKAQVLTLPGKFEKIIEVEMESAQSENYEVILDRYRSTSGDPGAASSALMRLRQAANHPLLTRIQYTDQKLFKIGKALCSKEKAYEKKLPDNVADDLSFLGDFQIHQTCEKFRSTRKFLLNEDLALQSGKCRELDALLPKILMQKEKVLIFSQFTMMLDILEVYLKVRGHKFLRLDGSTPVLERQELINQFNVDETISIFLLSTKAGGLGINLTSANHIIIHDIDFNPYNDKQAEDRCHRMGQTKPVYVTRLISKNSVENGIYSLAKRKLLLEKQVTTGIKGQIEEDDESTRDSNESEENKLSSEDLQNLLAGAIQYNPIE